MNKRLFLFAGYNQAGKIDASLIYHVRALSQFGDIILCMDSDCTDTELKKIQPYCLHTSGAHHGEYDFGSYKRAYIWASENLDLSQYDFIYMVNDSVYGPLRDLSYFFATMEKMPHDAFGLVKKPHKYHPHIQSWFIGLTPSVFMTPWFNKFMHTIKKLPSKGEIIHMYEHGLSRLITAQNLTWECIYSAPRHSVYNLIKILYRMEMPFLKKSAFTRNHGALGGQLKYILKHISPELSNAILSSANDIYGPEYTKWLLTSNPFKIGYRNIRHAIHKIFIEGI